MASNTRERILNAAKRCYQRLGVMKTAMEDIAVEAGISRRTLYRHFASRQEILSQVVQQAATAFLEGMSTELKGVRDFNDFFVEALLYSIEKGPAVSSHSFLFSQDILTVVNELYLSSASFRALSTDFWQEEFRKRSNEEPGPLDMAMVAEWFNRLTLSYLATPGTLYKSEAQLKQLFTMMIKPALGNNNAQ